MAILFVSHGNAFALPGECKPEDENNFPFNLSCTNDPGDFTRFRLTSSDDLNSGSHGDVYGGGYEQIPYNTKSQLSFKLTLDPTSYSRLYKTGPKRGVLFWATIDIRDEQFVTVSGDVSSAGGSSPYDICPGTYGAKYPAVHNYKGPNPENNSRYTGEGEDREDCLSEGKMVWWYLPQGINTNDQDITRNFTVQIKPDKPGRFCIRGQLSVGNPNQDGIGDIFPPVGLSAYQATTYNSVAAHLAKKSIPRCFEVMPPPPQIPGGQCYTYTFPGDSGVYTPGPGQIGYPAPSEGYGSSTSVYITGVDRATTPNRNAAINDRYGSYANRSSYTYNYTPGGSASGPDSPGGRQVSINIQRQFWNGSIWQTVPQDSYRAVYDCFKATCTITSVTGLGPGNTVAANKPLSINVRLTNTSRAPPYPGPDNGPLTLNGEFFGSYLGIHGMGQTRNVGAGQNVGPGGSVDFNVTYNAPNGPGWHDISFQGAYLNAFDLGDICTSRVKVYKDFTVSVNASSSLDDDEDPSQATYQTTLTNNAPVSVDVNDHLSEFYSSPAAGGKNVIRSDSRLTFGPGSTTTLTGTYPIASKEAGDRYCAAIKAGYSSAWVGPDGSDDIIGASGSTSDIDCPVVNNKPYFKVYGQGVSSGGTFSETSGGTCSGGGYLASWFNNTNPAYGYGASSQLSALAAAKTYGVASAQTTYDRSPTALSFANTIASDYSTDSSSPALGGNFGSSIAHCLTNMSVPTGTTPVGSTVNLGGSSGKYYSNANTTINSSTINRGEKIWLFVDGDVRITGNGIRYNTTGWTKDNVPSVVVRATGNIYIDNSVDTLDGLYIAQPKSDGTGGTIFTCSNNGFGPRAKNAMFNQCKNQLTVHGSFVANKVNLMRTYGTLRNEKPKVTGETRTNKVEFRRYTCPDTFYWNHYYQAQSTPKLPSTPNCSGWRDEGVMGYILPTAADGAVPLYYKASGGGSNANHVYSTNNLGPGSIIVGYAHANPQGSSSGANLMPIYVINIDGMDFYTSARGEAGANRIAYYVYRTSGQIVTASSVTAPASLTCSNAGTRSSNRPTCAAEVFEFSPEMYINNDPPDKPALTPFDAITSLPPVL